MFVLDFSNRNGMCNTTFKSIFAKEEENIQMLAKHVHKYQIAISGTWTSLLHLSAWLDSQQLLQAMESKILATFVYWDITIIFFNLFYLFLILLVHQSITNVCFARNSDKF